MSPEEIDIKVGAFVLFLLILAHISIESSLASEIRSVWKNNWRSPFALVAKLVANALLRKDILRFVDEA